MNTRRMMPLLAVISLLMLLPSGCGKKLPTAVGLGSGFPRSLLLEVFTSQNCTNCPKADAAAEQIAAAMGDSVCLVELHPQAAFALGDSIGLAAADTLARSYEGTASGSLPLFVCDGTDQVLGTAADVPGTLGNYRQVIDVRKLQASPLRITVSAQADLHDIRYSVRIESDDGLQPSNNLGLVLAVVEDSVNAYGKSFRYVVRRMYPSVDGTHLSLLPSSSTTQSGSLPLDGGWLPWRLTLVAYVRDNGTREVIQSAKARVAAAVAPPAAPALDTPADGLTNVPLNPILRWNASSGAVSYSLHVATDSGFTQLVHYPGGLTGTSQTLGGLINATTYFWRVNASNSAGASGWSSVRSFTTTATPLPAAPVQIVPADGDTSVSKSPVISWAASAGATGYSLQLASSAAFNPASIVSTWSSVTGTSQSVFGLNPATRYYWRVSASNIAGPSPWSVTRSFVTTTSLAPDAPLLIAPIDGATAVATNGGLAFVWRSSYGASGYRLQVSACSDFRSFAFDQGGLTDTSRVVTGLDSLTTYYWRVNASDASGSSAWSGVRSCADAHGYSFSRLITTDPALRLPDTILSYSQGDPPAEVGFHFYLTNLAPGITAYAQAPTSLDSDTTFWGQLCSPRQCAGPDGIVSQAFSSGRETQDWTVHFLFNTTPPAVGWYHLTLNIWAGDAPGHVMSRKLYVNVIP